MLPVYILLLVIHNNYIIPFDFREIAPKYFPTITFDSWSKR